MMRKFSWQGMYALITAVILYASGVQAQTNQRVGRQADGSVVTSDDQIITPAGAQIEFYGRPTVMALSPDGKTAAFLTAYANPITTVDLTTRKLKQQFVVPDDRSSSFAGLLYSRDGRHLYASQTGALAILNVAADGVLSLEKRIPGIAYPGGLALSADSKKLYIALSGHNALGVFDLATQKLEREIPVGNAPHDVMVIGNTVYVTNLGGRPALPGDFTNDSYKTRIVADPGTGGPITGTVSVVNPDNGSSTSLAVGLEPTGMTRLHQYLFVANTNSDSISVIDTRFNRVVKTISVQPFPNTPYGSMPNALLMVRGTRLVVSLGRSNALAVYRWQGPSRPTVFEGLIPTAWYPGSLVIDAGQRNLMVANVKGVGSLGAPTAKGFNVHSNQGSLSIIPLSELSRLPQDTLRVAQNNRWDRLDTTQPSVGVAPRSLPLHIGEPSPIKHTFYIVKENRTYDQILGDDARGNGAPTLTQFGANVTPNQHELVKEFQLLDNFYASGSLSADGHQWVLQANSPDYLEKAFGGFVRSYPYDGGDSLAYLPTGFIWQNALRHGLSVRVYGEFANSFRGTGDFGLWKDWYRDSLIMEGKAAGDLHRPLGTFRCMADVPSLDALLNRDYPPFDTAIPDQYRADIFLKEFGQYVQGNNLPNLILMTLGDDHTSGTSRNIPTPSAQVADNDLAAGRIIDAISHSPYWPTSVIFMLEDDAQAGVDHVDGHRTTCYVISPYTRKGAVIDTYYTQIDVVRSIEQILGLPPMNQMDLAGAPMFDVFTDTADTTPYQVIANNIPLNQANPGGNLSALRQAWSLASTKMFPPQSFIPDLPNEQLLNRVIWYSTTNFKKPYPGDKKVLFPNEVLKLTAKGAGSAQDND